MKIIKARLRNIYFLTLALFLLIVTVIGGCRNAPKSTSTLAITTLASAPYTTEEVEDTDYEGRKLTPISQQGNNALAGTQSINQSNYRLTIDGLVDHPLSLSYTDLQAYPQISQFVALECVEGWGFFAKWTGPSLDAIFADAGIQSNAVIAIFYTSDDPNGYTSLDLSYIDKFSIIAALKDNDIILSPDRGFPFQIVANGKFGYKWAKWVTRIELSSDTNFRGFWETRGYSNSGDILGH
jgi:DMSO/TMAO reductase YedYZ molybdopterin-dependent catalytic subunit